MRKLLLRKIFALCISVSLLPYGNFAYANEAVLNQEAINVGNNQPEVMNISNQAVSQITSEVTNNNGLPFQIRYPGSKPTSIDPSNLLKSINVKPNEAPYQVSLKNESVSTISGGLTYQETDAYLPGRNGLSFALTRTYNSQNSQEFDMDVSSSYNSNYYIDIPINVREEEKVYKAKTIMSVVEEKILSCNALDSAKPDSSIVLGPQEKFSNEYSNNEDASNHIFTETVVPWSQITCGASNDLPPVLGIPSISYENITATSVDLKWSSVSGADSYTVFNGGVELNTTIGTTYTVTGLTAGKEYTFYVSAHDENGNGERGSVTVTTLGANTKPSPPASLSWKYTSATSISMTWEIASGASSYNVYLDNNYIGNTVERSYSISNLSYKTHTIGVAGVSSYGIVGDPKNENVPIVDCTGTVCPDYIPKEVTPDSSGTKTRISYYPGDLTVVEMPTKITNTHDVLRAGPYNLEEATMKLEEINSFPTGIILNDPVWEKVEGKEILTVFSIDGLSTMTGPIQETPYFFNTTISKKNPIGIGWNWNIPSLDTKMVNGISKHFVSLGDNTVYEIDGNLLKGDIWNQYSFSIDESIISNSQSSNTTENQSKYVVSSNEGKNYYFNEKGNLIVISDSFGNRITFNYVDLNPYGSVLSTIEDAIGNQITFTYQKDPQDGMDEVVIRTGQKEVIYKKEKKNNIETLSQVINASGTTTFSYLEKEAKFNLLGNDPLVDNPYMLLEYIVHPTQAKTNYTYTDKALTVDIGLRAVNQIYKVVNRNDEVFYENSSSKKFNNLSYSYEDDLGTLADYTFKTIVSNGLTTTTYNIDKEYIDENTPTTFYTNKVESKGLEITKQIAYTYNRLNRNPYPKTITTKNIKNAGTEEEEPSKEVTILREYKYGKISSEETPLQKITTDYEEKEVNLEITSPNKPATTTKFKVLVPTVETIINFKSDNGNDQNILTLYGYELYTNGNTKSIDVTTKTNNKVIQKAESYLDDFGCIYKSVQYKNYTDDANNEKVVQNFIYDSVNHAFVEETKVDVKDADDNLSTISKKFGYDSLTGNITSYKSYMDGKEITTLYQYDLLDRLEKVTFVDPDNIDHPETFPTISNKYYDSLNEIVTTNEVGEQIKQKWNPLGWKTEEFEYQDNNFQRKLLIEYDDYGRVYKTTDAKNYVTETYYDEWNRPTIIYGADYTNINSEEKGEKTTYNYNDINNSFITTDNDQNVSEEIYDELGRVQQRSINGSNIEKYYYTGDDYKIEDANNYLTSYEQNVLGKLTSVTYPAKLPNIPVEQKYTYQYDFMGNLEKVTYPGNMTLKKTYDELGRLITETNSEGKIEKYYYDENNNLKTRIDKNLNEFKFEYNYRNYLTKKQALTNSVLKDQVEYFYDKVGRITDMKELNGTNPSDTTHYEYYLPNDLETEKVVGLLKKKTLSDGATFEYRYDKAGNRSQMDIKIDSYSWSTKYSYDKMNRMSSVNTTIPSMPSDNIGETYTYQNNGLFSTVKREGYSQKDFTYNGFLLDTINEQKVSNGPMFTNLDYDYDKSENISIIKNDGNNQSFSYDELNRVKNSSINNEIYTYDNLGNRQTLQSDKELIPGIAQYDYTLWNQLSKVTTEEGKTVEYKYNGDGLMVQRAENNTTTRYYYDGNDIVAEGTVIDGKITSVVRYLRGADGLIARVSEDATEKADYGGIAYYQKSGHGDIVSLRDKNGELLRSYTYDIWGNIQSEIANKTVSNPFLYSGEYFDSTTKLQYLRSRWYDPSIGRFISEDTYEGQSDNPLSLNLYTYVENNPLKYSDPSGHVPVVEMGEGGSDRSYAENPTGWMLNMFKSIGYNLSGREKAEIYSYFTFQDISFREMSAMSYEDFLAGGTGLVISAAGIFGLKGKAKGINLPSYKKIDIDMEHIMSGHNKAGNRAKQSGNKDLFPGYMSEKEIENAVRNAYRNATKRLATQGDRVLVQGKSHGMTIEMWVNTKTKIIETAYPKW